MINTAFKAQVQNRIDTFALGTTPLTDLLKIQTQANGLGCNTARLDAEIQARASAAAGGTSLSDLAIMGLLLQNRSDQVYYQTPVAVNAGDKLYIDALGNVRTDRTPLSAAVTSSYTNEFGQINFKLMPEGLVGGDMMNSSNNRFCVPLANGNWLVGHGFRESSGSGANLRICVVNSTFDTVLSTVKIDLISATATSWQLIGIRETSANVFRIFYTGIDNGTGNPRNLNWYVVTYNSTSHAVTNGGASNIVTNGNWRQSSAHWTRPSDLYIPIFDASNSLYVLNTATSALTQVAGVGTNGSGYESDRYDPSTFYGRILVSGAASLFKADTAVLQSLPANLTADGCFGSAWNVRCIGPQRWLCVSAGAAKLVYFNAGYTTATIYTLATAGVGNPAVLFNSGDTYTCYTGGTNSLSAAWSFDWSGVAAPTNYVADLLVPSATAQKTIENFTGFPVTNMAGRTVSFSDLLVGGTQFKLALVRANTSEYAGVEPTWFATALGSAAASGFVEVKLQANTQLVPGSVSSYQRKAHQNLLTTMRIRQGYCRIYGFTPDTTSSSLAYLPEDIASFRNADIKQSALSGAIVMLRNAKYFLQGDVDVVTPHERLFRANATSLYHVINADKPMLASFRSSASMYAQEPIV